MDMCDLDHDSWAHNLGDKIRAYSLKAANADEAKTLWERTMKEVHEGWATPIGSKELGGLRPPVWKRPLARHVALQRAAKR
jgi:hypothetical protein